MQEKKSLNHSSRHGRPSSTNPYLATDMSQVPQSKKGFFESLVDANYAMVSAIMDNFNLLK